MAPPIEKSRVAKAGLAAWFAAMVGLSAILLGRHLLALPRPSRDDAALKNLSALRQPDEQGRVMAVHVLYSGCKCSARIVKHLTEGARPGSVVEDVLLVGDDHDTVASLTAHGFRVTVVDADELGTRWHIRAVPLLVVLSPQDRVLYAGGYTTKKQGPDPRDLEILTRARAEQAIDALPVYGCAVAEELRRKLDPTGTL